MQINNSVVNLGGMNTVQGNAFQRSVKIPGQKGKEYQELFWNRILIHTVLLL